MSGRTMSLPAVTRLLDFTADAMPRADLDDVDPTEAVEAVKALQTTTYELGQFTDRITAACERAGVNGTPVPHPVKPLPLPKEPPPEPPKDSTGPQGSPVLADILRRLERVEALVAMQSEADNILDRALTRHHRRLPTTPPPRLRVVEPPT